MKQNERGGKCVSFKVTRLIISSMASSQFIKAMKEKNYVEMKGKTFFFDLSNDRTKKGFVINQISGRCGHGDKKLQVRINFMGQFGSLRSRWNLASSISYLVVFFTLDNFSSLVCYWCFVTCLLSLKKELCVFRDFLGAKKQKKKSREKF